MPVSISVIQTVEVPLGKLVEYPHNPRRGEVDRLVESIEAHGQFRALVVNKPTMQVLAGNHTSIEAWRSAPFVAASTSSTAAFTTAT